MLTLYKINYQGYIYHERLKEIDTSREIKSFFCVQQHQRIRNFGKFGLILFMYLNGLLGLLIILGLALAIAVVNFDF